MGSVSSNKPHAVLVPFPAQSHITPFINLAKLLYASHGFHITFVNTNFTHQRLIRHGHPSATAGFHDFRFEAIPDGLPPSNPEAEQFIPALMASIPINFPSPFHCLLKKLNTPSSGVPPITCIICDGIMSFALDAARHFGIPGITFWTASACGFMGYLHFDALAERGLAPLKGEEGDEVLNTPIDWIPGMKGIRLRDLPSFQNPTDPDNLVFNYLSTEVRRAAKANAIIFNTFDELERPVLNAIASLLPSPVHAIGPISLLSRRTMSPKSPLAALNGNLLTEEKNCLAWLDGRKQSSVIYVSFGSIFMLSESRLADFAWGLAESGCDFLWAIQLDVKTDQTASVPPKFREETKERGMVVRWCAQEKVLTHPAVGGFLTHCGWNSMMESIAGGVPVICWPVMAEQMTNCKYACNEWGMGMEIGSTVKREEVAGMVREIMFGRKGKEMKKNAGDWKKKAERATGNYEGSSCVNFATVVKHVISS